MAIPVKLRSVLKAPLLYLAYQSLVGGIRARKICIWDYAERRPGMVVIDIGCGPGYPVKWLADSRYFGFDICREYIEYAKRRFGSKATFSCELFTEQCLPKLPKADLVLMMGLLHHLNDQEAVALLTLAKAAMKDSGTLISLDGCYRPGQSRIDRYFLDSDRGEHIRDEGGYVRIAEAVFSSVQPALRKDLFRIPYTCMVLTCRP